uniref:Uncharacterized protein n=1 Tax=Hottentotta judaicus TaxID=6863 RepID=F1CJ34_HOTJU|nr:hypothetical protein [Hottentotta judaicus]
MKISLKQFTFLRNVIYGLKFSYLCLKYACKFYLALKLNNFIWPFCLQMHPIILLNLSIAETCAVLDLHRNFLDKLTA